MNFKCSLGLYHDRDTSTGYVSGNGVLYSAYADNLDLYLGRFDEFTSVLKAVQDFVYYDAENITTYRYINNGKPDSIDNIIGFVHFGFLNDKKFISNKWYFNGSYKRYEDVSWYSAIVSAYKIRDRHRNTWWLEDFYQVGKLANLVAPQYRHYILKMSGEKTTWYYLLAFYLHILVTAFGSNISAKNICELMLKDTKSRILIKLFNKKKQYADYFPIEHDFNKVLDTKG